MKLDLLKVACVTFLCECAVISAFADIQSNPPATTSLSTTQKSILDTLSDYGTLSYFGVYHGGSLSNPGGSLQPKIDGTPDPSSPQVLDSSITAGYKIQKDLVAGAVAHFYYFPSAYPMGTNQNFQFLDPILFVSKFGLIDFKGFKLDGRLTAHLPVSSFDALVPNHLAGALSTVVNAHYETLASKLTVGVYGYLRGYIPTDKTPSTALSYFVYTAPYANYQLTSTIAATVWLELVQAGRKVGSGFFTGLQNTAVDVEPGISWDITKNITFNPGLNIFLAHPTLASTSIQAFIIAKAF